jgi:hypothetical protein
MHGFFQSYPKDKEANRCPVRRSPASSRRSGAQASSPPKRHSLPGARLGKTRFSFGAPNNTSRANLADSPRACSIKHLNSPSHGKKTLTIWTIVADCTLHSRFLIPKDSLGMPTPLSDPLRRNASGAWANLLAIIPT